MSNILFAVHVSRAGEQDVPARRSAHDDNIIKAFRHAGVLTIADTRVRDIALSRRNCSIFFQFDQPML
ncbi:MAG TPA: hypothetical protein VI913_01240 [Candidatus Peribacteraceae bacterium]|nr:hypothetical protein [Candidatus Peribacteraceae bacterium]